MLIENADEPYAEEIAAAVAARNRKEQFILTTYDLRNLIEQTLSLIPADGQQSLPFIRGKTGLLRNYLKRVKKWVTIQQLLLM